eukprot:3833818-Rhodomonas_salina.1
MQETETSAPLVPGMRVLEFDIAVQTLDPQTPDPGYPLDPRSSTLDMNTPDAKSCLRSQTVDWGPRPCSEPNGMIAATRRLRVGFTLRPPPSPCSPPRCAAAGAMPGPRTCCVSALSLVPPRQTSSSSSQHR